VVVQLSEGESKTKQLSDWRKFNQNYFLTNRIFRHIIKVHLLFSRFSFFSLAETTPLRALAEVRLRFSF
jgi:hypothetical protein